MCRKLKKTRATTKKNIMHTQNIFVSILRELKVPFTNSFALLAYEEHPYKYTFYGLKKVQPVRFPMEVLVILALAKLWLPPPVFRVIANSKLVD